jgi:hypothetical protein
MSRDDKKPYSQDTMRTFKGLCKGRIIRLTEARQSILVKTLTSIGRDDEVAAKLDEVIIQYDHIIEAERVLFRYLFGRSNAKDTPHA